VKLVLCSDLHTDRRTLGVDRFDEISRAAHQTVDALLDSRADVWAFLGDLCDPEDGPEVARGVELLLELVLRVTRERKRSVLLAGNHDVDQNGRGRTTLSPLRALARDPWNLVTLFESGGSFLFDDVQVLALPYPPVSGGYDMRECLLREVAKWGDQPMNIRRTGVVLAHATYIPGALEGEETLEMPRGRAVPFPLDVVPPGWAKFCGHFHTPQMTPGGVVVPGALARLTRGEAKNEPRFLIAEI